MKVTFEIILQCWLNKLKKIQAINDIKEKSNKCYDLFKKINDFKNRMRKNNDPPIHLINALFKINSDLSNLCLLMEPYQEKKEKIYVMTKMESMLKSPF